MLALDTPIAMQFVLLKRLLVQKSAESEGIHPQLITRNPGNWSYVVRHMFAALCASQFDDYCLPNNGASCA